MALDPNDPTYQEQGQPVPGDEPAAATEAADPDEAQTTKTTASVVGTDPGAYADATKRADEGSNIQKKAIDEFKAKGEQGIDTLTKAQEEYNSAHQATLADEAAKKNPLLAEQAEAAETRAKFAQGEQEQAARIRSMTEIMANHANQFAAMSFKDPSTQSGAYGTIGGVIGGIVGGFYQGLIKGQTNPYVAAVDNKIKQDLYQQQVAYQRGLKNIEMEGNIISRFRAAGLDAEQANHAAYVAQMEGITKRLDVINQTVTDPKMKEAIAQGKLEIAKLQAPKQQALSTTLLGKQIEYGKGKETFAGKELGVAMRAQTAQTAAKAKAAKNVIPGVGAIQGQDSAVEEIRNAYSVTPKIQKDMKDLVNAAKNRGQISLGQLPEIEQKVGAIMVANRALQKIGRGSDKLLQLDSEMLGGIDNFKALDPEDKIKKLNALLHNQSFAKAIQNAADEQKEDLASKLYAHGITEEPSDHSIFEPGYYSGYLKKRQKAAAQ